jgi:hypothetical protein
LKPNAPTVAEKSWLPIVWYSVASAPITLTSSPIHELIADGVSV